MQDYRIRLITIIIVIFGFISLTGLIRKRRVELKYALVWYGAGVVILLFSIFPGLMEGLSHLLGIVTPVNMLFFLALIVLAAIVMELTAVLSAMSQRVRKLVQEVALLKDELKQREDSEKPDRE